MLASVGARRDEREVARVVGGDAGRRELVDERRSASSPPRPSGVTVGPTAAASSASVRGRVERRRVEEHPLPRVREDRLGQRVRRLVEAVHEDGV